jgi:DNA-binding CsgD family transcriptional regulator
VTGCDWRDILNGVEIVHSPTFVGRADELTRLRQMLETARGGVPTGVFVAGPAGVGKTRLLREVTRLVADTDLLMIGHCVDLYGAEIPYCAPADALRDLVHRLGAPKVRRLAGPHGAELSALLPELAEDGSGVRGPDRVLDAYVAMLGRTAQRQLVWLWLEDLQWADRGTLALLTYLLKTTPVGRLFVSCTLRTEPSSEGTDAAMLTAELIRLEHVHTVDLPPFGRDEVGDQLAELRGTRPPTSVIHRVHELSGGIPFLTQLLVENGVTDGGPVTPSIADVVMAGLDRLSTSGRLVVEAASVESRLIPHDLLVAVVGPAHAETGIPDAVSGQVLVTETGNYGYRFRHALLRESIAGQLLPASLLRWHRRWAEQLESAAALRRDPFARITAAHHWVRAGDATRGFDAALAGAQEANKVLAALEEARMLVYALSLWSQVPDAAERAGFTRDDLVRMTVTALVEMGGPSSEADAVLDSEIGRTPDQIRDIFLRLNRGGIRRLDELYPPPGQGVADILLNAPLDNSWLAVTAASLSFDVRDADPELARKLAARAVTAAGVTPRQPAGVYEPASGEGELLFAQHAYARALATTGDMQRGIEIYREMLPHAGAQSRVLDANVHSAFARCLWAAGNYRHALSVARRGLALIGYPHVAQVAYANLMLGATQALTSLGHWSMAWAHLSECLKLVDDERVAFNIHIQAGLIARWRGDLATAESHHQLVQLGLADRRWPEKLDQHLAPRTWLAVEIADAKGDIEGVRRELEPLWAAPHPEVASEFIWQPLLLGARIEADVLQWTRDTPRTKVSRRHLDVCQEVASRLHTYGAVGLAWTLQLRAEVRRADGINDSQAWEDVADAWAAAEQKPEQAYAQYRHAKCLLTHGDTERAGYQLGSAAAIADSLGARPLASNITTVATRARLRIDDQHISSDRSAAGPPLTARETQVLQLLAEGHTNKRIARELYISPRTAAVHVHRILAKLQVSSRGEAGAVAHQTGLLEVDSATGQESSRTASSAAKNAPTSGAPPASSS